MGSSLEKSGGCPSATSREGIGRALRDAIASREVFAGIDRRALAQQVTGEQYFAAIGKSIAAADRLAAALAALDDDGFVLQSATREGRMLMLNASAQRAGRWQLTRFDKEGEPWGDTQYERKLQAISELIQESDLQSLADMQGPLLTSAAVLIA